MAASPDLARSPIRRRVRRIATTATVAVVIVGLGGYAVTVAVAPTPPPVLKLTVDATQSYAANPATAQAAVANETAPTAVGWADGEEIWANTTEAVPIASLSKLVTALVTLETAPLEAGADGPVYVWTDADADRQAAYLADEGIAFPIPVGTEVTTRQMLQLALIPSANDFATALAYSTFGDNDTFVAAVNDWTGRHGLASVTLAEPSGMDERNAASPADLVRIARLALAEPTIAEITAQASADLPWGIGAVESTNPLHGLVADVRGMKTGTTNIAGSNLLAAQGSDALGRPVVKIAAVLSRADATERVTDSVTVLGALDGAAQSIEVVADGSKVGTATTVDGLVVSLISEGSASTVLLPGEEATSELALTPFDTANVAAGQPAGAISVTVPTGSSELPLITTEAIAEPGFWWRFTHPGKIFFAAG